MRRSHLLLIALAATLAACGSDNETAGTTAAPSTEVPATAAPSTEVPSTGVPATDAPVSPAGSTSQDTRELTGIRWVLDGFITVGAPDPVPTDIVATLTFTDTGNVSIETGCNQGSATVTLGEGGMISFGPATLTKMACAEGPTAVETRMVALLELPSYWSAHDGTLTIYPATVTDTGMLFHSA